MEMLNSFLILLILGALYFAPMIIACSSRHPHAGAIFALNFFLGWTFLFWVVALCWALTNPRPARR